MRKKSQYQSGESMAGRQDRLGQDESAALGSKGNIGSLRQESKVKRGAHLSTQWLTRAGKGKSRFNCEQLRLSVLSCYLQNCRG